MDVCDRCGAELDPADSYCTSCGSEFETAQYCVACGIEIDSEIEWGEEGLCRNCADMYAGLP